MKTLFLTALLVTTACFSTTAQVGIGTTTPHASAAMDISSTNKGLLPPRMSWSQIQAIPAPAAGLLVYDVSINAYRMFNGTEWVVLAAKEKTLSEGPGYFSTAGAVSFSGVGNYTIARCKVGPQSSVYLCGIVRNGTISFGPFSYTSTAPNNYNAFIAKLDSNGTPEWLHGIGGSGAASAYDLAVDASGNLFLCGDYSGSIDFDPSPTATSIQTSTGGTDGWYARFSPAGALQWVKTTSVAGNISSDRSLTIATDGAAVYVGGNFNNTVVIGSSTYVNTGDPDLYLLKASAATGSLSWSVRTSGGSSLSQSGLVATSGGVVLGGIHSSSLTISGTTSSQTLTAPVGYRGFVASYNSTGGLQYAHSIGNNSGGDAVGALAADDQGNIYVAGKFEGTVDFDPAPTTSGNLTSQGGSDAFIAIYNNIGAFVNAHQFGGPGNDGASSVCLDNTGAYYLGGTAEQGANFGLGPVRIQGDADLFLLKGNTSSLYPPTWVQTAGSIYSDAVYGITASPSGRHVWMVAKPPYGVPFMSFEGKRMPPAEGYVAHYFE